MKIVSYIGQEETPTYGGWYAVIRYFYDETGMLHQHGGNVELRLERSHAGGTETQARTELAQPFRLEDLEEFRHKFPDLHPADANHLIRDLLRKLTEMSLSKSEIPPPYFFEEDARTEFITSR